MCTFDGVDITADVDAIRGINEACLSTLVEAENLGISAEVRELLSQSLYLHGFDRLEGRAPQTSGVPFDLCEHVRFRFLVSDLSSGRLDGTGTALRLVRFGCRRASRSTLGIDLDGIVHLPQCNPRLRELLTCALEGRLVNLVV